MFLWLTVGARARFLNLKGRPVDFSLLGSTEFGRLWKILEKAVLQLPSYWLRDILPGPSVCLSSWRFFLTQFFWPNLSGEYTLPSELPELVFDLVTQ